MEVLFCGNWVFAALEVQTWVEFLGFDLMCTCDADSLGFLLCKDKDRQCWQGGVVSGGRARLDDSLQAPCVTPLEVDYCTLGVLWPSEVFFMLARI